MGVVTMQLESSFAPSARAAVRSLPALPDDEWLSTLDDDAETSAYGTLIARAVQMLDARSVLDVGCGIGSPTLEAAHAGADRVVGIDIVRDNVARARANFSRSGLQARVKAHHASWDDVASGRLAIGSVDLVVSNPPYVPSGPGSAVDGGPNGTTILNAIIDRLPASAQGLGLMFGSLSDPLEVIDRIEGRGFSILDVQLEPVPFGRYTSAPRTLAVLKQLRQIGRAWFCDVPPEGVGAPHAYLTIGVIARRSAGGAAAATTSTWRERLESLLGSYQRAGRLAVHGGLTTFGNAPAAAA